MKKPLWTAPATMTRRSGLDLLDNDAVWVAGVVAALLAMALMVGNTLVTVISRVCGRRTTILLWAAVVFAGASVAVGLTSTFVFALAALLVSAVAMGVTVPVRQAFIHGMVPSEQRATIVSFNSMISGAGAVGGQAGLGFVSGREGFAAGYVLGGTAAFLAVPLIWAARRMRADADPFVGSHHVHTASCTPQGVPAIASIEGDLLAE